MEKDKKKYKREWYASRTDEEKKVIIAKQQLRIANLSDEEREKHKAMNRERYYADKEKFIERSKAYKKKNRDRVLVEKKAYYERNKDVIRIRRREYRARKMKSCPLFALSRRISNLILLSINNSGLKKSKRTEEILGCSFESFKAHIESQFKPWMTWANRGLYNGTIDFGWDLDHIIPMSSALTEEDVIRLNHYSNFQPLCSYVNRFVKKDKVS